MIVSATGLGNAVKIAIAALKKSAPRLAAIVAAESACCAFLTMKLRDLPDAIPLTIDAQYVPGFTWLRNPEARIVQNFGIVSAGLAAESPQAVIFSGPNAPIAPTSRSARPATLATAT